MAEVDFFIVTFLLLTFVDRGVDGGNVTGVLHGRVALRGRYGHNTDLEKVEWTKYAPENSTKKLLRVAINPYNVTCFPSCQTFYFNLQSMSLILFPLTKKDEGIYEERATFKNQTFLRFNITLSVQPASKISVSSSPGSLTLKCDISDDFKLLQWFRNDLPLPDDQRFSLTENNKTMQVSNFNSSDCGNYTCLISNEYGTSAAYFNVSDDVCENVPLSLFCEAV
ncbi:contactin-6-like [Hemibagrus wyckioides]|uniref:contactin-6-like n=1 Tax=Hemibagrus wyckioides TaxID=337641 RepID=UPI00266D0044|nr:contactin-6-like [Hemibagrus wyckioides]XP_058268531.1 contactin-6-like [Hemibagrus wyckioides]XP_058268532.1 contactin-6-like [Hemibagrus wyckioides]